MARSLLRLYRDAGQIRTNRLSKSDYRSDCDRGERILAPNEEVFGMRPDHIYLAMIVIKHSTLAAACIFAYKIAVYAIKASM